MGIRDRWLKFLAEAPRYHKWPRYEVLELLRDESGTLNGFRIHFSNRNSAHFLRTPEGVDLLNFTIARDGTLGLMVGSLDELQRVWMVDGRSVDFGDRPVADGFGSRAHRPT